LIEENKRQIMEPHLGDNVGNRKKPEQDENLAKELDED
jgi:hypothetical protein